MTKNEIVQNASSSSNFKLENEKLKEALARSSIEFKKLENEIEILKLSNNLLIKSMETKDITKKEIANQKIQICDESLPNFEKQKSMNSILKDGQLISEISLNDNQDYLLEKLNNEDPMFTNNIIKKELIELSQRLDRKCNELISIKDEISKCINKLF
jgi:hypothetical protein